VLATGIWIVAGSSGLAGLAQSYPQLLLLRGIGGVGSAMFTVAAMSLLLRVVDADRRGQATATWQAGFLLGGILGPGVGGALAASSVRAPFFVYAGTLAVAGAIGMLYLRRPPAGERAATSSPDEVEASATGSGVGLRTALTQRPYLAALTASLATGWSLFGVLMPLFVTEVLGLTTVWTGLGFLTSAVVQVVALIPAARITDRVGRRPSLIVGTALGTASYLLVAANESLAAFLGSMVIFGIAAAFLGVAPAAIVGDVVTRSVPDGGPAPVAEPRRIRGSRSGGGGRGGKAVAIYQMASDFGVIVGPLIAGELAERYSFSAAFAATAALIGAACAMAIWMPETRTVRQPEPAQSASRE
jgi:MFS family permease